jgi:hypothetical protein
VCVVNMVGCMQEGVNLGEEMMGGHQRSTRDSTEVDV